MTTTLQFDQRSYQRLVSNLSVLPRRVGLKVYRVALNAWGGVVKAVQIARARRGSGLLAKSPGVKVTIPDASYNIKHRGKPAYVIVGPRRSVTGLVREVAGQTKSVTLARLKKTGFRGNLVRRVRPSRYAHLVEKGIAGTKHITPDPFVEDSVVAGRGVGMAKFEAKLGEGINREAAALPKG